MHEAARGLLYDVQLAYLNHLALTCHLRVDADDWGYEVHAVHLCIQDSIHREFMDTWEVSTQRQFQLDPQRVVMFSVPAGLKPILVNYFIVHCLPSDDAEPLGSRTDCTGACAKVRCPTMMNQ